MDMQMHKVLEARTALDIALAEMAGQDDTCALCREALSSSLATAVLLHPDGSLAVFCTPGCLNEAISKPSEEEGVEEGESEEQEDNWGVRCALCGAPGGGDRCPCHYYQ